MTSHRPSGVLAFVILLSFVLSSCYKSALHEPEPQLQIAIDARNPVLQLPIYVAVKQRLFAAQRLRITVQDFPDAAKASGALLAGASHLASTDFDQILLAQAKSHPLTAFVLLARSPSLSLVRNVPTGKRHQSARNLTGGRIAIQSKGYETDQFARYATRQSGVDPKDVEIVPTGSMSAAAAAMEQWDTTAAVVDVATLQTMETRGLAFVLLADTRSLAGLLALYGVSTYPASCLYTSAAWLSDHRDQAIRIARAIGEAQTFIRKHKAEDLLPVVPESYRKFVSSAALASATEQARPLFSRDGLSLPTGRKLYAKFWPFAASACYGIYQGVRNSGRPVSTFLARSFQPACYNRSMLFPLHHAH